MFGVYGEACFNQKMFINGLSVCVCYDEPDSKRQFMKWKCTDSPVKKNYRPQLSVNRVMLTVFRDMKRLFPVDFLEKKGATVNSSSNCELLRQNSLYL